MLEQTPIDPHILPVYIKYERLTASSLGEILSSWGEIANIVVDTYVNLHGVGLTGLPTLEIDTVNTGNSIKFSFGEGWLPTITTDSKNDIIINTPKKLGIPLLLGFLLLSSTKMMLDVHNAYLDNQIKRIEKKLKETEFSKLVEKKQIPEEEIKLNTTKSIERIIQNNDYKVFQIYDIDIKNIQEKKDGIDSNE